MLAFVFALFTVGPMGGGQVAQKPAAESAAKIGEAPAQTLGARDMAADYKLPPLADAATDPLWKEAQHLQVLARATQLKIDDRSATEAWQGAEATVARARAQVELQAEGNVEVFRGTRFSELNALLARHAGRPIRVVAESVQEDVPLKIDGTDVDVDFGTAAVQATTEKAYAIRVEGATNVHLRGGRVTGKGWAVLVSASHEVAVTGMTVEAMTGGGMVVTNSTAVSIWGNTLRGLNAAPVMLHGQTRDAVVAHNQIMGNLGASNWHAGVVVTDRNADLASDPRSLLRPDDFGVKEQPIVDRLAGPQDNVIAWNEIAENKTSGIYSDGSVRTVIFENRIERNAKEGICLDNGSAANVVVYNRIEANGQRWGKSDFDLQRDFVLQFGRLPDGTSPAKLPGLSIDNAAYNLVAFNEINRNYGGGIKMVRTGYYNRIGMNTITDDNEGANAKFHFFGMELGGARADVPVPDLDFTPSRGNEIFANMIRGPHYSGIFFAAGSDRNMIFDNTILGATDWAMESVVPQANKTLNNLTNEKLRNIRSGLDPALFVLGEGVFDPGPGAAK